jgi:hypothetical protein
MKLWTMLAGLTVAGILANSAFAQDDQKAPPKKGNRGGFALKWADFKDGDKALADDGTLTEDIYVAAAKSKVPAGREVSDQMVTRIKTRYAALCKAAEATDSKIVGKAKYEEAVKKMPARSGKKKAPSQNT